MRVFVLILGELRRKQFSSRFLGNAQTVIISCRTHLEMGLLQPLYPKTMLDSITVNADWPLIVVSSPLRSLQLLAKWYRHMAFSKVLAITGSNGKTIVKDALKAIFAGQGIVASPGSYNSQLGLPLAVLSGDNRELWPS